MIAAAARAKVNLALGVIGRRDDGFHELVSVFLRLDLADRISVRTRPDGPAGAAGPSGGAGAVDTLRLVEGPDPGSGPNDLVLRAARLLRAHAGIEGRPLGFVLEKRVPIASGLGGGSADAAAALGLAAHAWGVVLSAEERLDLAARLGSDVPFFAADVVAALVQGRGELLTRLPAPNGDPGIVLVMSPRGISTAEAFAELGERGGPPGPSGAGATAVGELTAALRVGLNGAGLAAFAVRLRDGNDLWPVAASLRPELAARRSDLESRLGIPILLSVSGPTFVGLYASRDAAERAAAALGDRPIAGFDGAVVRVVGVGRGGEREDR